MAFHTPLAMQNVVSATAELWPTMSTVLKSPWQRLGKQTSVNGASQHRNMQTSATAPVAQTQFPQNALRFCHPVTRSMPLNSIMARQYSTFSRNSLFANVRPIPRPGNVGLALAQQRSLFGGPTHAQLARYEQSANNNPSSASAQATFYQALLRANMPKIVIDRYKTGQFATNTAVEQTYQKALEKAGQSGIAGQGTDSMSAEQLQAVGQAVAAHVGKGQVGKTKAGSGNKSDPLYVVVEESLASIVFKWVRWIAGFALCAYVALVLITLFVETSGVLKKVGGANNAEVRPESQSTRFSDVQGCDEAKEELTDIVDFLKNPERYNKLGGRLPKGVLLIGPPGTGKTLLARATLNQLLNDLDGFDQSTGVIFIAATNHPELLDKALLRPGRFDRHVQVELPDVQGRLAILKHHTKKIRLSPDADLSKIARGTPGFSGAELENLANTAAIQASKHQAKFVSSLDLEWAKDKIMMGSERKTRVVPLVDKLMTAYHEAGHALVGLYAKGFQEVHKATILPRGPAAGITFFLPPEHKHHRSKAEYESSLAVSMGGTIAEEIVYGAMEIGDGASSDISNATRTAHMMVTAFGFSEKLGSIDYRSNYEQVSPETKRLIDNEVRRLVEEAKVNARRILTERRTELDRLATALVQYETLDKEEIMKVIKGEKLPDRLMSMPDTPIKLPEIPLPPAVQPPHACEANGVKYSNSYSRFRILSTFMAVEGKRGRDLASDRLGPNNREATEKIGFYDGPWDPVLNPDGLVNLGTAENTLMLSDIAEFIKEEKIELKGEIFDYGEGAWGSPRLRKAVSGFINSYFNPSAPTKAENMTITNGCSSIFNAMAQALSDPGDGVLLSMPSYVAFPPDFGLSAGMRPIFTPFNGIDQFGSEAFPCYESALASAKQEGIDIKIMILCNPHNPLGRCYPPSSLLSLLKFCNTHKIHLIADEIYAMSVYSLPNNEATTPFTSVLSLNWQEHIDPQYFHHVYGMSKDFSCGGLRIGSLWTLNAELQRAVTALSNFHYSGPVNSLLTYTILEDDEFTASFLGKARQRIADASLLARGLLDEAGIRYLPANAGFFLWICLEPWLREEDGVDGWERREADAPVSGREVFIAGGRMQAAEEPGWFRFVFTKEERLIREGVKRLKKVCGIE
ncbi:i-AAA protease yme1 [Kalmusia sp. IMI 367209]|nr:i-AAA protease yme1 [Kalmusia sp. IMI 367209]